MWREEVSPQFPYRIQHDQAKFNYSTTYKTITPVI